MKIQLVRDVPCPSCMDDMPFDSGVELHNPAPGVWATASNVGDHHCPQGGECTVIYVCTDSCAAHYINVKEAAHASA